MEHLKFVIESTEAEKMAKNLGYNSVLKLLPHIARSAQKLAIVPISKFSVGAVGLASDGRIFIGVNVEFPGLPLHHSIHAEQFLVTNLSLHPKTTLTNVVVSAYPCGHCRQFLQEIRGAPDIMFLILNDDDDVENKVDDGDDDGGFLPLSHFLPNRFGPHDLLPKDVPLILESIDNKLVIIGDDDDEIVAAQNQNQNRNGVLLSNGFAAAFEDRELVLAALDAANKSHAPYSGSPSGVALKDVLGNVFSGSYMESAAYNPSMGPAQSAIVAYMAAAGGGVGGGDGGGVGFGNIVAAVLVEVDGAIVKQQDTVRLFLNAVSPKCEFRVFHCRKSQ